MNQFYEPRSIKRDRRTKAQIAQLDAQILEVLAADHPQSVRHVFYRMTDQRLPEPVTKDDRGYRHVQHRLTELRRSGRVPYGWITDATRSGYHVQTYGGASDFLRSVAGLYRADLWSGNQRYVEVWVESRSIAGVLQADCKDLAVSLYPCAGFASITLAYEAARHIDLACRNGKTATIFYIGDHDPAGVLIDRSLEGELRRHLRAPLEFVRLGITESQSADYGLPEKPRKAGDRRSLQVETTVEAEAMPAAVLRAIVRDAVESLLPPRALAIARLAEANERRALLFAADELAG
ncbi:MAG: hypothetical protein IT469_03665 [Pseudomonadales bacterium]|nr:hypothetical protein [Pseudomonadales bacterium]